MVKLSIERVNEVCGVINWNPTEEEIIDGDDEAIREICDFEDRFDPSFELETDEHEEWVRNAKGQL